MTIRSATIDDAPAIAAIWNHYITTTTATFNPTPKTITDVTNAIEARPFWVCSDTNTCGFASYGTFRGGVGYARTSEHTIWLHPNAQGQGWGRKLMKTIEDHAKTHGIHTLIGAISADNTGSIAFHRACGFEQSALLPRVGYKFDQFHDLVLMQKYIYQET
jgi:phosphinothricin acetyltransferase